MDRRPVPSVYRLRRYLHVLAVLHSSDAANFWQTSAETGHKVNDVYLWSVWVPSFGSQQVSPQNVVISDVASLFKSLNDMTIPTFSSNPDFSQQNKCNLGDKSETSFILWPVLAQLSLKLAASEEWSTASTWGYLIILIILGVLILSANRLKEASY